MGSELPNGASDKPSTDIRVAFANSRGQNAGRTVSLKKRLIKISDFDQIPDYEPASTLSGDFGLLTRTHNRDYYRDVANHLIRQSLYTPIRFWLKNEGSLGARDIHIDLTFSSEAEFLLGQVSELSPPTPHNTLYYNALAGPMPRPGQVDLSAVGKTWQSALEVPALQPKRELSPMPTIELGVLQTSHVKKQNRPLGNAASAFP